VEADPVAATPHTAPDLPLAESLLALTRAMSAAAQEGRWEELVALEAQRRPLIAQLFVRSQPVTGGPGHDRLAALVHEMQARDRQTADLAEAARCELADILARFGRARHAVEAYEVIGGR
jgi:hypothetical protein